MILINVQFYLPLAAIQNTARYDQNDFITKIIYH